MIGGKAKAKTKVAPSACLRCDAPISFKVACCPCCCVLLHWYESGGWYVGGCSWWQSGPPVHDRILPRTRKDAEGFVFRIWGDRGKVVMENGLFECKRAGYVDDGGRFHQVTWSSTWAGLIEDLKPIDSHPRLPMLGAV